MCVGRTSQHRIGCGMPRSCRSSCFQEALLWCGIGEPEFQVLWRINLFDLLHSAKEDLVGIALVGDFVLVRAAELDLLLCEVLCLPCSLAAVTLSFPTSSPFWPE